MSHILKIYLLSGQICFSVNSKHWLYINIGNVDGFRTHNFFYRNTTKVTAYHERVRVIPYLGLGRIKL